MPEPFSVSGDDPLTRIYPLFQNLLDVEEESLNTMQRALLYAVHALRKVRQAENTLDAITYIWQSIEFLTSGSTIPKIFTDSDRKALVRVTKCLMDKRYKDGSREEQQQRHSRVANKINELNRANARQKWEAFCATNKLSYTKEDLDFLWETRDVRNDIVHGRITAIDRSKVLRASVIVEKAIAAALEHMVQATK